MAVANNHGAPASTLVKFGALLFVALWGVGIVLSGMRMNDKAMVSPALPVRKRRTSLAILQSRGGEDATVLVSDLTRLERVVGPSAVLAESQHVCVQADDNPLVNVTVVTLSTSHLPVEAREAIWRNRVNYAFCHGYRYCDFSTVVDPWRNPKWSKLLAVMSALPCTGLVIHIDADAIITDTSVRVEDVWRNYNPEGKHVMWSTDYGEQAASPLNSGVYMLAATEWSFHLLRRMYNEYVEKHTAIHSRFPHVKWTDQMAVFDFWEDNKEEFSNNTKLVPYTVFNSWRKKVDAAAGRQLPFIVHYAGIDGTSTKKYDTILKEMRDPAWFGRVHDAWPDGWPQEFTWPPSGGRLVPAPPSGRRWWPAGGSAPQLAYATPMPFALSSEFEDDPQRAERTELRFVEMGEQHSGVEVEWLRNGDTPVTDGMVLPHLHGGPWVGTPTGPVDGQHCDTAVFTVRKVWRGEWPTEDDAALVQARREMEKTVAGH